MDFLKRGDVLLVVATGDYGKPRPALIVQSDLFNDTHASITLCPITTTLVDAPLFRVTLQPNSKNGLHQVSQVMVDKILSARRDRIRARVGHLSGKDLDHVDVALRKWLTLP